MLSILLVTGWALAWQSLRTAVVEPGVGSSPDARVLGRIVDKPWIFDLLIVLTLVVGRWISVMDPVALNPDEAQMLAQALRFQVDPIPWRSVDGTTGGPFDSYVLLPLLWLGFSPAYTAARLTAIALLSLFLCLTHRTLGYWCGEGPARLTLLPLLAFLALASHDTFVHYASELLPIAFLAAGLHCLSRFHASTSSRWLFLAGVSFGAVPFAKIQGAPLAVALFSVAGLSVLWRRVAELKTARKPAWGPVASLFSGGLTVPALLLGTVAAAGSFRDFWLSYIDSSIAYQDAEFGWSAAARLFIRTGEQRAFLIHVALIACVALIGLVGQRRSLGQYRGIFVISLLYLVAAILTVRAPNRPIAHYVFFVLAPLTLTLGCLLAAAMVNSLPSVAKVRQRWLVALVLLFAFGGLAAQIKQADDPKANSRHLARWSLHQQGQRGVSAAMLDALTQPGEQVAIWGWKPSLYVESGTIPATRDAIAFNQIKPSPRRAYFRDRYLFDFQASAPPVVVDAVHPSSFAIQDPERQGLRTFPELWAIVQRDYLPLESWLGDLERGASSGGTNLQFYIAKTRIAEIERGDFGPPEALRQQLSSLAQTTTPVLLFRRW